MEQLRLPELEHKDALGGSRVFGGVALGGSAQAVADGASSKIFIIKDIRSQLEFQIRSLPPVCTWRVMTNGFFPTCNQT